MGERVPDLEPAQLALVGETVVLETFRKMLLARFFEDKISALYRAGKVVGGVYLGRGQEAFSASLGIQLNQEKGDIFAGLIRDQAGRMAFGESLIDSARTYLGSVLGPMKGRDGNIHRGRPAEGMPAMISHLGASVSVVNGMLLAKQRSGRTDVVGAATAGDGATSTGAFHEAVNQAAVEKLPLVVSVANNQFAYSTSVDRQFACADLADRAIGYGISGYSINGVNLLESLATFRTAIDAARAGGGPQLIVGRLLRLAGHGEHDDARYVPDQLRDGEYGRDCIEAAKDQLQRLGLASGAEIFALEEEAQTAINEAVAKAQGEPSPNPAEEQWDSLSTSHLIEGFGTE
ncbi:MAG: thiamine pyrophosphate-dependent dehydrogenase E1 component subunit alpha [Verrucomicrobiota bacterium]